MKSVLYPSANALLCYHYFSGAKPIHVYLHGAGIGSTCVYPSLIFGSGLTSYHTLMPDFLGFGYSERPEGFDYTIEEHADSIAYLLGQVQASGCTVIGASLGGAVAITLATKHPDLVGRLVLAEGVLDAMDPFGIASQSEEHYITSGHIILMEQFRQLSLLYDPSDRGFYPAMKLNAPHALYRSLISLAKGAQPSWREQLYQLKIPRLYIWGEENFRGDHTETFTAHGIQEAVIPHAGHAMMLDNPEDFVRAISEFSSS
jgi:pimeloyl-ACP methyl ester carboxylesterase